MRTTPFGPLFAALIAAGLSATALAHDRSHSRGAQGAAAQAAARPAGVELTLPDARLVDQDGRSVRLKSDVLAGRVAVVNFVYTTCTTVCPVLSATMAELQRRLGARVGTDVQLVSITVDPLRDTPARLKAYSARHEAGSGWRWLSGSKSEVDAVLKAFGIYTPSPEDHPAVTMIGEAEGQRWTRLFGFPGVDEVLAQVEHALAVPVARQRR